MDFLLVSFKYIALCERFVTLRTLKFLLTTMSSQHVLCEFALLREALIALVTWKHSFAAV